MSLYGSSNWSDDLAEFVALYHLTEVLKQPYRIVIRRRGEEIFVYEPMKSDIVRGRVGHMKRFYEVGVAQARALVNTHLKANVNGPN